VHNFRRLSTPRLAVNQSDVELISHAYAHTHESVGTGLPSVAQRSRKQAGIESGLVSRSGFLRRRKLATGARE
jgi:hypothetical protein